MNPQDIRRIGRWPVRGFIGKGGFSWVFEVEDTNLKQRRALKMLQPGAAQGEGFKRFWREARILAAQDEPNLVRIFELDRDPETGLDYYVMEYLTGQDLSRLIKQEGALPPQRALEIFNGALQGLARLHGLRPPILHRDIKPANIQITDEGRAKILDLGIARVARAADETIADSELTSFSGFIGTVRYASPEQLHALDVGPASDVFSMALCLFEALEGRHVYDSVVEISGSAGTSTTSQGNLYQRVLTYYAMLEAKRDALPLRFRRTPKLVQAVLARALAIRPQDRYRDAAAMREALLAAMAGHVSPADRAAVQAVSRKGGSWVPIAATSALLLALVAGGVWWMSGEDEVSVAVIPPPPVGGAEQQQPVAHKEASTEQQATRRDALRLRDQIEAARAAGGLDPARAGAFTQPFEEAEALWAQEEFDDADQKYAAARSLGSQILTSIKEPAVPDPRAGEIAAAAAQARSARDAGQQAGASSLAASDWERAEAALAEAESAEEAGRSEDALAAYGRARSAFEAAGDAAKRVLADAESAQTRAHKAQEALPSKGSCSMLEPVAAAAGCRKGEAALASGAEALAARDAAAARQRFLDAEVEFKRAAILVAAPPPNELPALAVQPGGPLELEVGGTTTIVASASDPEGEVVAIEYTVRDPRGSSTRYKGTKLQFAPKRPGQHKIEVTARDAQGGVAKKTVVASVVGEPNRAPELAVDPAGSVELEVGGTTQIVASAQDPEGGAVSIEYSVRDPKGRVMKSKGGQYVFAPKAAGKYTIDVVARDADGEPAKRTVVAMVRAAAPPPIEETEAPPPLPRAPSPEAVLDEYAAAVRSCDIGELQAVWKMDGNTRNFFQRLCDTYGKMAISVTPTAHDVKGQTATLRFTQSLQGVTADGGKLVPIAQGPMLAQLTLRKDGWQITSLKAVK